MSNSFLPTQIGYVPTGVYGGIPKISTVYLGRNVSGAAGGDGVGLGQGGRPDFLQTVVINLSTSSEYPVGQWGTITLNVDDITALYDTRESFPLDLNLTMKEVLVCENGQTKAMVIIGSQTYATGAR